LHHGRQPQKCMGHFFKELPAHTFSSTRLRGSFRIDVLLYCGETGS
jgi:hypothetical protein